MTLKNPFPVFCNNHQTFTDATEFLAPSKYLAACGCEIAQSSGYKDETGKQYSFLSKEDIANIKKVVSHGAA